MRLVKISYFLTFLFVISITTPSIFSYLDIGCELAELVDKGEEEESKGEESLIDQEFKIINKNQLLINFNSEKLKVEFVMYNQSV